MPQWLAIEWDAKEARVAVARTRGKEVVIEHSFAIDVGDHGGGESSIGQVIAEALRTRGIGRSDTLVAIGRASIELRQLTLPPSPPEEMPELVRFQALRQFTTIGEDWPLDFVPLDGEPNGPTNVLAAAISPDLVQQIRATCQSADLTPNRLVLRPFAAASLLERHARRATPAEVEPPCRLMVDLLTEEADLTVLEGRHVSLMRTVRLPVTDDGDALARGLLGEIRRTIAAASNQLRGRRVEKIILCGSGADQAAIQTQVEQGLSLPVEFFDPFDGLSLGAALQGAHPKRAGRFAPLLGMLLDEANGATHALDFLHPRKKPEPVNTRRRNLLIAAAALVTVCAVGLMTLIHFQNLDDEIAQLRAQISGMKTKVNAAEKKKQNTAAVQEFIDGNYHWLDELGRLSEQLPPSDQVVVSNLSASLQGNRVGELHVDGYAKESGQLQEIQKRLRSEGRRVVSKGGQEDARREAGQYRWRFDETVILDPAPSAKESPK